MRQTELFRIRLSTDGDRWDVGSSGTGRSAYVCDSETCRQELTQKGRLTRALKRPVAAEQLGRLHPVLESLER
jgi:predicted RNA-binding protein YlxR (DUF448 family)